jgi:hypothetical protein
MTGDKTRPETPDATLVRGAHAPAESTQARSALAPAATAERTQVIRDRLVKSLDEVPAAPLGPLAPGAVVKDRFVLDAVLGKGGMGVVFGALDRRKQEARDPSPRVALKVLNADFERHPQSFIALQREARKAQSLAHPNVVTVFDFDRDGDTVYMTMELLQGRSLDAIAREARGKGVGRETALPIIRGVAEGLAYAHRKGIVHSDLKPGNVFIAQDGTAKILDFGIARATLNSPSDDDDAFDAGALGAYTEAYATDEMVNGADPHPADDMYALGLIAYELLTGCHPYQRHSAPGARKLGLKPGGLRGLKRKQARAIERCLSFDRKVRPQDASEFLKAFRGVTMLQQGTLAAAAALALALGYASYRNYVDTGPATSFAEISADQRQRFLANMAEGDKAWVSYEEQRAGYWLQPALEHYASAYDIHPRNRDAVAALNRVARAALASTRDADERREIARQLQQQSAHFAKYAPVVDAAH